MDSQPDFFEELPSRMNPRRDFAQARVDKKIIPIPLSFWKGGRMRADLSAYGLKEVVSRNKQNFVERIIQALQHRFNTAIVEIISEEFARHEQSRQPWRSPFRKKYLQQPTPGRIYANPFVEDKSILFGKYPDWLLVRRELKPIEKLIYGRLLFPLPPICERWDKNSGIIIGLNQGELAKAIGLSRQATNERLISLQQRRLIECFGAAGAKQVTRFLWQRWMPETCKLDGQVAKAGADSTCPQFRRSPVSGADSTCPDDRQVSIAKEKRDLKREEKRSSSSPVW